MVGNGTDPRNPFRPGAGARPPLLAGRETEITLIRGAQRELEAGGWSRQGILLYGPRGTGKTALLTRAGEEGQRLGLRTETLPPSALRSRDRLTETLRRHAGLSGGRLTGLQLGPLGASGEPAPVPADSDSLLDAWIERDPKPLVILMDEVHTLDAKVGREFFEAVQTATTRGRAFLILAAGTPETPRRVHDAATFTERMFESVPVGRLAPAAARDALARPAADSGKPFTAEALSEAAVAAQEYPFFIQLIGSAVWEAARRGEIGSRAVARGLEEARPTMEKFYGRRFEEAKRRRILEALVPVAESLARPGARISDARLASVLRDAAGRSGNDCARLETALVDLGVLWEAGLGRWEMGIPSFADYVLRRTRAAGPRPHRENWPGELAPDSSPAISSRRGLA